MALSVRPTTLKPAAPKPQNQGRQSERIVKRYMAQCPFESCAFNERDSMRRHATKDAAVVETIRHLRASDHLEPREVSVKRIALIQRNVVSEEVV